jgi:transposase
MYAFVGCDPKLKQSGEKMVGVRMSKRWNAYTRKKLYQCAYCSKLHCTELKQIYDKAKERGKHRLIALNIVVKKLIHIMRGIIEHKTLFDPAFI